MRTESCVPVWVWSNIFIGLSGPRAHNSYILPPPPSNIGLVCLFTSTIYHWDLASLAEHQSFTLGRLMVMVVCVIGYQSSTTYIIYQQWLVLPLSSLLCTSHHWCTFWWDFLPNCSPIGKIYEWFPIPVWEWIHIWQGRPESECNIFLVFRKFLIQILINFHGVIPGVLGIFFYYNWSLFNVEENIWISKIPSDTHPHPGLIWYLESYPSIRV